MVRAAPQISRAHVPRPSPTPCRETLRGVLRGSMQARTGHNADYSAQAVRNVARGMKNCQVITPGRHAVHGGPGHPDELD